MYRTDSKSPRTNIVSGSTRWLRDSKTYNDFGGARLGGLENYAFIKQIGAENACADDLN